MPEVLTGVPSHPEKGLILQSESMCLMKPAYPQNLKYMGQTVLECLQHIRTAVSVPRDY